MYTNDYTRAIVNIESEKVSMRPPDADPLCTRLAGEGNEEDKIVIVPDVS